MGLGCICGSVGTILMMNDVVWRWIFTLRGERHYGSIPFQLFWVGLFVFFMGMLLVKAGTPRGTHENGERWDL